MNAYQRHKAKIPGNVRATIARWNAQHDAALKHQWEDPILVIDLDTDADGTVDLDEICEAISRAGRSGMPPSRRPAAG